MPKLLAQGLSRIHYFERRKHKRVNIVAEAYIKVRSTFVGKCLIKDLSLTGAKIAIPEFSWVPEQFTLQCPNSEFAFQARKIWSNSGEIGVKFIMCENNNEK